MGICKIRADEKNLNRANLEDTGERYAVLGRFFGRFWGRRLKSWFYQSTEQVV